MPDFVDYAKVRVVAGAGGNGVASIRREKFRPMAGPDGGNGGKGGSIYFQASSNVNSLIEYRYSSQIIAQSGQHGQGKLHNGSDGEDLVKLVPLGTQIRTREGQLLADLKSSGESALIARGGVGGLGNAQLAGKNRKAPGFALLGEPGESFDLVLELKLVADVALVGYPSAGKSTLISAITNSKPKIADYPFTTLHPNLGVVKVNDFSFVVTDVPGLIEGAAEGKGLGLDFLKHIERVSVIVHVIDCATYETNRDPFSDFEVIQEEIQTYLKRSEDSLQNQGASASGSNARDDSDPPSAIRHLPSVIVLNKIDQPEAKELADLVRPDFEARGFSVFQISGVAHQGLQPLIFKLGDLVRQAQEQRIAEAETELPVLHPKALDDHGYQITKVGDHQWTVFGQKLRRWISQTDQSNPEALGYLSDRLAKLPIEQDLADLDAETGDDITIGAPDYNITMEYQPHFTLSPIGSPRGTDKRIDLSTRLSRKQKKEQYQEFIQSKLDI
ncbi:MAG: GTPase ObgE [Bifidobacteriaceae bacterium]|jgi:GTP-binding protein|nr:GTPase ObgE [Bifidobacteriaceae bacterium]